jgi:hypothetical protein
MLQGKSYKFLYVTSFHKYSSTYIHAKTQQKTGFKHLNFIAENAL